MTEITPKPRSNSVNDTLSTASSSMASDITRAGEGEIKNTEKPAAAVNVKFMKRSQRNAMRQAKKNFASHHNLAYGLDDDTDENNNASKEVFY